MLLHIHHGLHMLWVTAQHESESSPVRVHEQQGVDELVYPSPSVVLDRAPGLEMEMSVTCGILRRK